MPVHFISLFSDFRLFNTSKMVQQVIILIDLKFIPFNIQADIKWPQLSNEFDFHQMNFPMGGEFNPRTKVGQRYQVCVLQQF